MLHIIATFVSAFWPFYPSANQPDTLLLQVIRTHDVSVLLLPAALWRGAGRHGGLSSPLRPLQGGRPAGGEDGGLDQGGALPPHLDCQEYGEQVGEVVFTLSSLYMETLVQVEARLHNWRDRDDGGHGDGRTQSRLTARLSEAGGEDCQWDDPGLDHRGENCEYLKLDFSMSYKYLISDPPPLCVWLGPV